MTRRRVGFQRGGVVDGWLQQRCLMPFGLRSSTLVPRLLERSSQNTMYSQTRYDKRPFAFRTCRSCGTTTQNEAGEQSFKSGSEVVDG